MLFCQSASPEVIAASGDYFANANNSVSWTLGEAMTETYSASAHFMTQGFQQPAYNILSVANYTEPSVFVYPNPVINNLWIDFEKVPGNFSVELFDSNGKLLRKEELLDGKNNLTFSFNEYEEGIYLLNIIGKNNIYKCSYKIVRLK